MNPEINEKYPKPFQKSAFIYLFRDEKAYIRVQKNCYRLRCNWSRFFCIIHIAKQPNEDFYHSPWSNLHNSNHTRRNIIQIELILDIFEQTNQHNFNKKIILHVKLRIIFIPYVTCYNFNTCSKMCFISPSYLSWKLSIYVN